MICSTCDRRIGKMYAEYEIRGVHPYFKTDFCCKAAEQYYIPLEGWEKL